MNNDFIPFPERKVALSSKEIVEYLMQEHSIKSVAARKQLERLVKKGVLTCLLGIGGRRYLYCLPSKKDEAITIALTKIKKSRKKLYRLVRVLETAKILTIWEAHRITALPWRSTEFERILYDLELLGLAKRQRFLFEHLTYDFLVLAKSTILREKEISTLTDLCKVLQAERYFVYLTESWLKTNALAKQFGQTGFRERLFDSIGRSISPRFSIVLLEVNIRRQITQFEMQGFIERVYKLISCYRRRTLKFPIYAFLVAKDFERDAWKLGLDRGIKMIRTEEIPHCRVERTPTGLVIHKSRFSKSKSKYWLKRIGSLEKLKYYSEMKGRVLEQIIEYAFKQLGYDTEWRKKYFVEKGQVTEKATKMMLTDIDVEATNLSTLEIVLCECKNWDRESNRSELLDSVRKMRKISEYLRNVKFYPSALKVKAIFIGSCRKEDIEVATKKAGNFSIEVLTKIQFREEYCKNMKDLREHEWLFE